MQAQPTHLQVIVLAPQERLRRSAHRIPRVPPRERGLPKRGVHRVLHAPNVVTGTVWRELLPYDARVRPGSGARARGYALSRGEEIGVL